VGHPAAASCNPAFTSPVAAFHKRGIELHGAPRTRVSAEGGTTSCCQTDGSASSSPQRSPDQAPRSPGDAGSSRALSGTKLQLGRAWTGGLSWPSTAETILARFRFPSLYKLKKKKKKARILHISRGSCITFFKIRN